MKSVSAKGREVEKTPHVIRGIGLDKFCQFGRRDTLDVIVGIDAAHGIEGEGSSRRALVCLFAVSRSLPVGVAVVFKRLAAVGAEQGFGTVFCTASGAMFFCCLRFWLPGVAAFVFVGKDAAALLRVASTVVWGAALRANDNVVLLREGFAANGAGGAGII